MPLLAHAAAIFFSLIETVKLNGLEPFSYLRSSFENYPWLNLGLGFVETQNPGKLRPGGHLRR